MTREQKLEAALLTLRNQLQQYQDAHLRKDPPQFDKAYTNANLVTTANEALCSADDPTTTTYVQPFKASSVPAVLAPYPGAGPSTVESQDEPTPTQ